MIRFPGQFEDLFDVFFLGIDRHLAFVEDGAKILVQFRMEDLPKVRQAEALFDRLLTHAQPRDVALPDMHDALGIVDQMVDLAFQDRFVVFLHLTSRHLDLDGQRQLGTGFHVRDIGADQFHFSVGDLIHLRGRDPLDRVRPAAAAFQIDIVSAHALALEGGTVSQRNRNLGNRDLQAADFHRLGNNLFDGNVRDHVLIGTNTRGKHLGNRRVGDGGETPVDGARRVGVPLIRDLSQRENEGKDTVFVVN